MDLNPFPCPSERRSLLHDCELVNLPNLFTKCPVTAVSPPDGLEERKFSDRFPAFNRGNPEAKSSSSGPSAPWYALDSLDLNNVEIPSPPSSPVLAPSIFGFPSEEIDGEKQDLEADTAIEPAVVVRPQGNSFAMNFNRFKYLLYQFSFFIGPGWLVSMAYLDPGNLEGDLTVGNIRTVPGSGYQLLWLLLVAHIAGWSLQVLAVRLGNTTGKDLARSEYNRPVAYTIWFCIEIAIIGADLQAVIGTALALNLLLGIPILMGIVITLLDTFIFLIIQIFGVRKLEFFFAFLIGIMTVCFWANFVISKPNLNYLFQGLFIPRIPQGKQLSALGLLGSIIMPHNLFLHSSLVQSRNIKRTQINRVKQANIFFSIETGIALIISFLINLSVVGSFANPNVIVPPGSDGLSLHNAHIALRNAFGGLSVFVWAFGLLAAGQNATMAGTFAGQFLMQGIFRLKINPVVRIVLTRLITIIPLFSITLLTSSSIDIISQWVNILQSVLLPIALLPLLKLNFSKNAVGDVVLSSWMKVCYALCVLAVVGGNLVLVFVTLISYERSNLFWGISVVVASSYIGILLYFALKPIHGKYCCHVYETHS
ncbi:putative divalent metal transporter [Cardiosporidium cionae]|uniref:Divalent metal transporter n=1 Tax=Cardiosporidium cionae TaxID=476202 RepID=A0ABQ7J590_9APIC|nr:putative divalent metal transporter [Cardiosporidium cionae]|eukprot:KAF8819105.1 putative divalent metal transporter [Cardiosporidium cionae]